MGMARLKKSLSAICGCALLLGVVGTGASAGATSSAAKLHFTTVGAADASIDDNGAFSVTVDGSDAKTGVASTTQVTGQLAENSGIGVRVLSGKTNTDAAGEFSHEVVSPRDAASGLPTGKIFESDGKPIPPTPIKITIKCTISYPPLRAGCTITISA
jgi:hypothetical protein